MDRSEISVITIYISIIASGWINNGKVIQGLEKIYSKKLRCEHHHKNFEESILRDTTPYGLTIYNKPGISGISPGFMEQWNAVLKSTERHLVKLLLKESEKVVSSLNNEFETLLLSSFPKNFKVERGRISKRGKKIVRSLQDKRIKKNGENLRAIHLNVIVNHAIMRIIVSNLSILRIESSVDQK